MTGPTAQSPFQKKNFGYHAKIVQKQILLFFGPFQFCLIFLVYTIVFFPRFCTCVFSCIRTEYGDLRSESPYSVWIQENTDQKNSLFGHFWRSVDLGNKCANWYIATLLPEDNRRKLNLLKIFIWCTLMFLFWFRLILGGVFIGLILGYNRGSEKYSEHSQTSKMWFLQK